jgi:hypothetical protein
VPSKTIAKDDKFAAQKHYADRQVATGMVRVSMWVPEDDKPKILAVADKLRKGIKV